jgi:HAMP domain-containing protein
MEFVWLVLAVAFIFSAGIVVGVVFHAMVASNYERAVSELESIRNRVVAIEKEAASKITAVKKVL